MHKLIIYIPTFNRPNSLKKQLNIIVGQLPVPNLNVEIIVRDNCSYNYNFSELLEMYDRKYVKYYRNITNIHGNANIILGFLEASENDFLWILSDNDIICNDSLIKIEKFISSDIDLIVSDKDCVNPKIDSFLWDENLEVKYLWNHGLISNTIYNLKRIKNYIKLGFYYHNSSFPHLAVILVFLKMEKNIKYQILPQNYFHNYTEDSSENLGDYSLSMVGMPILLPLVTKKQQKIFSLEWIKYRGVYFHLHKEKFPFLYRNTKFLLLKYGGFIAYFYYYFWYLVSVMIKIGKFLDVFNKLSSTAVFFPNTIFSKFLLKFKKIEKW